MDNYNEAPLRNTPSEDAPFAEFRKEIRDRDVAVKALKTIYRTGGIFKKDLIYLTTFLIEIAIIVIIGVLTNNIEFYFFAIFVFAFFAVYVINFRKKQLKQITKQADFWITSTKTMRFFEDVLEYHTVDRNSDEFYSFRYSEIKVKALKDGSYLMICAGYMMILVDQNVIAGGDRDRAFSILLELSKNK